MSDEMSRVEHLAARQVAVALKNIAWVRETRDSLRQEVLKADARIAEFEDERDYYAKFLRDRGHDEY